MGGVKPTQKLSEQKEHCSELDLFRYSYRRLAAHFDHLGQGAIERRLFGAMLDAGVVVLLLLVAKLGDGGEQFLNTQTHIQPVLSTWGFVCQRPRPGYYLVHRWLLHQLPQLIVVVLHNHRFHCHRTRHGRLFAQQRCAGAQRETGHRPQRRHHRRSHAIRSNQSLEFGAMLALLLPHVLDGRSDGGAAEHGHLAGVNAIGAQLAGMVDANELVDQRRCRIAAGSGGGLWAGVG